MKLEHVALNVPDPAALAQWLVDNLGMRIVVSTTESPYMHFVADEAGSMLELYNNPASDLPDYGAMSVYQLHLAYSSSDIEADRQKLLDAGAVAEGDVIVTPAGDKLAFFRAPQQVPFQLVQRGKPLV